MSAKRLGWSLRALRHRARLTQEQLGGRIGMSRTVVMRIEDGRIENIRVGTTEAAFAALDARIEIRASWHGAALDRLIDEGHAQLSVGVIASLNRWGWVSQVECSFSHFGERGSIDVHAWHQDVRALLVVEVKTELGSIDGLLRPLDAKVRLAPTIARQRFGWRPETVSCLVVFPDRMSVRRQVARHATLLDAASPSRGWDVRRWLRAPVGELRGLWFLSDAHATCATRNPSAIRRIRARAAGVTERASSGGRAVRA